MFPQEVVGALKKHKTPFYYYDTELLRTTLQQIKTQGIDRGYRVHFALKANHQPKILEIIREYGLDADCVSGGEIKRALECGFTPDQIAFAGVGKSDDEIELALDSNIFCFNVESPLELDVINEFAIKHNKTANVALRLNPNVNAETHHYITTGLNENKFGIHEDDLDSVLEKIPSLSNIKLIGIHFHIGSQIVKFEPFEQLCTRANDLNSYIESKGHTLTSINVGGGFGINYDAPNQSSVPDFRRYFEIFSSAIKLKEHQTLHFELGRSVVGQCGSLITKVLYTKTGRVKNFAVVDAGMTELLRPALYQAVHNIDALTSTKGQKKYDVVGPICESSDTFRKDLDLPELSRGDLLAIRSCGAYGEVMQNHYNLRPRVQSLYSDEI
ncbi:MAG: diaminopimelate decarboxylase [bacterium]|nr:diaminopimelate decarboxylase [bacterium]